MKVAISSTGLSKEDEIDGRFGRCPYFVIFDTEEMEFEGFENENKDAMGGAGIQTAQDLANRNVKAVITGNVGPNAFQTLNSAGIQVYRSSGKLFDAVESFKKGELNKIEEQTVSSHFGQGGKGRRGGRR